MSPISTVKVNCQDCHRCVRSCPVKAIGVDGGHARVVEDKCVLCGKCVVECPQQAKKVDSQLKTVQIAIAEKRRVVMSIAPSFVAAFPDVDLSQLRRALRLMNVTAVEETAVGAAAIAKEYKRILEAAELPIISACCPVVVDLVAKYYPDLTANLAPVVSPMAAHGRMIRECWGEDTFVVFAGPCIAKISEAKSSDSCIDAVLTFEQLRDWLDSAVPDFDKLPIDPNGDTQSETARFFPITGGILKSFIDYDEIGTDVITVNGLTDCMEVFSCLSQWQISPQFIEALACDGGCIGGPGMKKREGVPVRRVRVVDFARKSVLISSPAEKPSSLILVREHKANPIIDFLPSETEIREILIRTGKFSKEDEKNCGACGYDSCREKAIAVWQGLAELEMCIPYMRSKAESFANIIVDNTLNAIIVVDENMLIQEFNPAAEKILGTTREWVKGTSLSKIIDCTDFIRAVKTQEKLIGKRVEYPGNNLITEQMVLPVREHNMAIIIINDVTEAEKKAREFAQVKLETIDKAAEIINRQMKVAQEIAGLLGETTGETKAALLELVSLLKEKSDNP